MEFEETKQKLKEAEDQVLYLQVCNESPQSKLQGVAGVAREWDEYASSIM